MINILKYPRKTGSIYKIENPFITVEDFESQSRVTMLSVFTA